MPTLNQRLFKKIEFDFFDRETLNRNIFTYYIVFLDIYC